MYKVLLVDDEVLDLEGMRTFIPWEDLGLKVVDAVNNGFAACKVLEKEQIDILVTDVRMPNMSGLELAKTALDRNKDLRVIFVSGYQDFNYVKQALSLNAGSYVLKPMDDKELIEALVKVKNELDEQIRRRATDLAYKEMVPIVKNEYMLQLLDGSANRSTLDILLQEYRLNAFDWPGRIAVLEIDDLSWKLNPYSDTDKQAVLDDFFGIVLKLCGEREIEHVFRISKQRVALLLTEMEGLSVLAELIEHVKSSFPFTITAGVGGPVSNLQGLSESYRQAGLALESKMFQGKGRLIEFDQIRRGVWEEAKSLDVRLDALFSAMSNYELVRIHDELDGLFQLVMGLNSKFTIHNFAVFIIMKLDGYLQTMNESLFRMLGLELTNLDILLQFETIDDIQSWLRRRVFEISEKLHLKKQNKNWKLIDEIIDHVKERLHENITLKDVADQFSFSPNYLGHLFKERTGKYFSEYVVEIRMERASGLLKDSRLKIYEVADRVGYRYLPYFSRQFKETFGMTPLEYRRKQ